MKLIFKKKPWEGSQIAELRLPLPCQFWMLCNILEVDPKKLIMDFLATLGAESYGKQGQTQQLLEDYFIQCGYGQEYYSEEDIRKMMEELKAIGTIWPKEASRRITERHTAWRNMYHKYWYRKWYYKHRRKH
ncbi:hypothetical protein [Cesiribacter sp. SM1]|uniref:hypothetical protein n=1 Tax=Cesiribacter sp. SM1 TaxID=2861196 RepID=UPI001CD4D06C|nr:hypothetical protein [Cesiribacter sp. SM1]